MKLHPCGRWHVSKQPSTAKQCGIVAVIAGIAAGVQYQLLDARACRIAQLAEPTNHNIHNPPPRFISVHGILRRRLDMKKRFDNE